MLPPHRNLRIDLPVSIVGTPFKYTETPAGFYRRPPKLGEHNEEVLKEFGIDEDPNPS